MNSFALWFTSETEVCDAIREVRVDFSFWTGEEANFEDMVFDVGLTISSVKDINRINLYVPFRISETLNGERVGDIRDLGKTLWNTDVLNTLFNTSYDIEEIGGAPKYRRCVDYRDGLFCVNPGQIADQEGEVVENIRDGYSGKDEMLVYGLDEQTNIEFQEMCFGGTVVGIHSFQKYQGEKEIPVYIRFRIKSNSLISIIRPTKKKNDLLNSLHQTDFFIDFKFNDYRSLNPNLIETITREKVAKRLLRVERGLVQVILMTTEDVDIFSTNIIKQKTLDVSVWDKYFQIDRETKANGVGNNKKYLANYWQFEGFSACSVYLKLRRMHCSAITVMFYIFSLMFITILCNIISFINLWIPIVIAAGLAGLFIFFNFKRTGRSKKRMKQFE